MTSPTASNSSDCILKYIFGKYGFCQFFERNSTLLNSKNNRIITEGPGKITTYLL
jgi:hypothetical protein